MFRIIQESFPIITLFILLHIFILPKLCSNLVYSIYFQESSRQLKSDVEDIVPIADDDKIDSSEYVVVVLTSQTREVNYLNQTLTSLQHQLLAATEHIPVIVCSADSEKRINIDHHNFSVIQPCLESDCQVKTRGNKHVEDFIICYDAIKQMINEDKTNYQLWLEDDVELMNNFFTTLNSIMSFRRNILVSRSWLDLKLYFTPRLRGYRGSF